VKSRGTPRYCADASSAASCCCIAVRADASVGAALDGDVVADDAVGAEVAVASRLGVGDNTLPVGDTGACGVLAAFRNGVVAAGAAVVAVAISPSMLVSLAPSWFMVASSCCITSGVAVVLVAAAGVAAAVVVAVEAAVPDVTGGLGGVAAVDVRGVECDLVVIPVIVTIALVS
jgi:hypothetical protein